MASYQTKPAMRSGAACVVLATAIAWMTIAIGSAAQAPGGNSPAQLFQQATHQEEAAGDLEGAIVLYRRVLAAKPDRALAAKAQLRLALCLEKLGKPEARAALEAVGRDYGDQRDVAALARDRLAATGARRSLDDRGFVAREIWTGESLEEHVGPNDRVGFRVKPSADGQWLAFVDWATHGNVAIRHVTSGEIRPITSEARAASAIGAKDAQMAFHPVLSPDGTHVAYEWASAGTYSMRIAPVAGGRARVVPLPDLYVAAIRWAPDGRRLALIATGRKERDPHIALMSVSDGPLTRLKSLPWRNTNSTFGIDYAGSTLGGFSPDGRWLLYSVAGEQPGDGDAIFAIAVDGSQETKLVQGPSTNQSPAWSPDGRAVVFVSDRSTNFGLWSIPVAHGKPIGAPELLRANVGEIQGLGFNRDGSFFYGRLNAQDDVLAADLDPATATITSKPAPLINRSMGSNRGASWSPDQRRLAFVRSTPTGDAVVVRSADGTERTLPTRFRDGGYRFAVPVWFPDGRSLLIPDIDRSIRRKTYRRVQIDSMEEMVAFEGPNWEMRRPTGPSPDGTAIYYSKGQEFAPDGRELVRLVRRDLATGQETELFRADYFQSGDAFFTPSISPDGQRLAFVAVNDAGEPTLMTVPAAGGAPAHPLAHGKFLPGPGDPDQTLLWTKDGRFILVANYESAEVRRVWAIPSEGGEPRKLDLAMPRLRLTDVSADGRRLAFAVTRIKPEIGVFSNVLGVAANRK
jgi:Tol biopolymer transport system component